MKIPSKRWLLSVLALQYFLWAALFAAGGALPWGLIQLAFCLWYVWMAGSVWNTEEGKS